jgi:hypothetical protein
MASGEEALRRTFRAANLAGTLTEELRASCDIGW